MCDLYSIVESKGKDQTLLILTTFVLIAEPAMAVFRDMEVLTQWDAQLASIILHDG